MIWLACVLWLVPVNFADRYPTPKENWSTPFGQPQFGPSYDSSGALKGIPKPPRSVDELQKEWELRHPPIPKLHIPLRPREWDV